MTTSEPTTICECCGIQLKDGEESICETCYNNWRQAQQEADDLYDECE